MILGIGVDSIEISRVKKRWKKSILSIAFYGKGTGGDGTRKKERCF